MDRQPLFRLWRTAGREALQLSAFSAADSGMPGNKLVVFDRFKPDEVKKLTGLIATPEYRRLIDGHSSYYRGFWLATKLGRPASDRLGLLLSAIWNVTPDDSASRKKDAERARRYQQMFVSEVEQLPSDVPAKERIWMEARAANALRQLGRYREAEKMRRKAAATLAQASSNNWSQYLEKLGAVIARREDRIVPLDMIPESRVPIACAYDEPEGAFSKAMCKRPAIAAEVVKIRGRAEQTKRRSPERETD